MSLVSHPAKKKVSQKGIDALAAYRASGKKAPPRPKSTGQTFHIADLDTIRYIDRPYASGGNFYVSGNTITYVPEGGSAVTIIDNNVKTSHWTTRRGGRLMKRGAVRK